MDLNTIIPNKNDPNWIVKGDFLLYKKYSNIPIAYIEEDVVFIFLDLKVVKAISKLIRHLTESKIEFYFDSPEFSNPSSDASEYNTKVVTHYLYSHSDKNVFKEFKRINFDLIKNMVEYCDRNNCHDSIKPSYEKIKKIVLGTSVDWMSNKTVNDYPDEIRHEFENLYRDIQISKII